MWHLKWSLVAVFIFVGSLCEAHLNQPQQAFVGAQGGGQMMMQQQQQQVAHPAAGYGAAAQVGHHQVQPQMQQHPPPNGGNMLRDKSQIQDRAHIQEHLQEILGEFGFRLVISFVYNWIFVENQFSCVLSFCWYG